MATKYVFRRTCGFGGNNTYKNRLLAADNDSYKSEQCYTLLGAADLDYQGTMWVPTAQESAVLTAVGKSPKSGGSGGPGGGANQLAATIQKETISESSGGWFASGIGDLFGGSIEFGKKKTYLPFWIVGGVVLVILFGAFVFKVK